MIILGFESPLTIWALYGLNLRYLINIEFESYQFNYYKGLSLS